MRTSTYTAGNQHPARSGLNEAAQITRGVVNLLRKPNGARDRQLLMGADVTVMWREDGWAYVQAAADGYCGYVGVGSLGKPQEITHKVTAASSHGYQKRRARRSCQHCSALSGYAVPLGRQQPLGHRLLWPDPSRLPCLRYPLCGRQ